MDKRVLRKSLISLDEAASRVGVTLYRFRKEESLQSEVWLKWLEELERKLTGGNQMDLEDAIALVSARSAEIKSGLG